MNSFISSTLVCLCMVLPISGAKADTSKLSYFQSQTTVSKLINVGLGLRQSSLDCSHFVHALYERLGHHYQYATSRRLYRGFAGFRRTRKPLPGDLVVWQGHVGVVLEPKQHSFLSSLTSGIKVSSYSSSYWIARGHCRFFHFADNERGRNTGTEQALAQF